MGITQWNSEYPNRDILLSDADQGTLYALEEDSQFLGAVVLNEDEDPAYQTIPWEDVCGKALVIHRLAVNTASQGKGIGRELLRHAESHGRAQGYSSIRLDTYSDNPIALHVYEHNGYRICGEIFMESRELPFVCFEKKL